MKATVLISIVAIAVSAACLAGPPPFKPATAQPEAPIGRLGYRIGTYLTIEGIRAGTGKGGNASLLVDKVGDYKFPKPVSIYIDHFQLPPTGRCILKGFETGGWAGVPFPAQIATNAE